MGANAGGGKISGPNLVGRMERSHPQVDLHDLFQADDEALGAELGSLQLSWVKNVCCCSLQLLGESCSPLKNGGAWEKNDPFHLGRLIFSTFWL